MQPKACPHCGVIIEPEEPETWPEWFALGHGLKGWTVSLETAEEWREKNEYSEEFCLDKIYVLRGWWNKDHEKKGRDPYATFQRACREDWGAQKGRPKQEGTEQNKFRDDYSKTHGGR